jgi:hypothetical protein
MRTTSSWVVFLNWFINSGIEKFNFLALKVQKKSLYVYVCMILNLYPDET